MPLLSVTTFSHSRHTVSWASSERLRIGEHQKRETPPGIDHIDVPYRLQEEYVDVSVATDGGDFDYPRAVAGGLDALFMSIYIPADVDAAGGAKDLADELIDKALVGASPVAEGDQIIISDTARFAGAEGVFLQD